MSSRRNRYGCKSFKKGTGQYLISNKQLLDLLKREKFIERPRDNGTASFSDESRKGVGVLYLKKATTEV